MIRRSLASVSNVLWSMLIIAMVPRLVRLWRLAASRARTQLRVRATQSLGPTLRNGRCRLRSLRRRNAPDFAVLERKTDAALSRSQGLENGIEILQGNLGGEIVQRSVETPLQLQLAHELESKIHGDRR